MKTAAKFALVLAALLQVATAAENVSNTQVVAAIRSAVETRSTVFPKGSCSNDVVLGASIPNIPAAKFVVAEVRFDRGLGQARFLLRRAGDRQSPPFYAWCNFRSADLPQAPLVAAPNRSASDPQDSSLGPMLVDTRRPAKLYLHSEHSAMLLSVRPLQPGHKDERIRVRLAANGKTIAARVVGPDALDASF